MLASNCEHAAAWLRRCAARFWERWEKMSQRYPDDPRKRLNRAFALLAAHVSDPAALGCGMAEAALAIGPGEPTARRTVEAHKARLREKLAELCVLSGAREPALLAEELFGLMAGAQATVIMGVQAPARDVARAAAVLIESRFSPTLDETESHP